MSKFVFLAFFLAATAAVSAYAQASNPDPNANSKDVFLDNHRPLIEHKEKPPTARTVTGKVVDDSGQPIEGAVVTLTNTKTHEKRQFITKTGGRFSFEDVSFTIDYELEARYKDQLSDTRKLSQYDHNAKVVRILTVGAGANTPAEAKKEPSAETKQ